jgi:hypothetical protein
MSKHKIEIVLPEGSRPSMDTNEELVSSGLREITKRLGEINGLENLDGLGGQYGYGHNYDSDVFQMHRYCWCDQENCPWCEEDAPNFHHKASGFKVWWYKYIGRGIVIENPKNVSFVEILAECCRSIVK